MSNTKDLKPESGLFALFKGSPKEGKSIAAHSFPNTYTLDFDNKIRAAMNWFDGSTSARVKKEFDYDVFNNLIDVKKKIEEFKDYCTYNTIIVDGITEAANLAIRSMIFYREPQWKDIKSLARSTNANKTIRAGVPLTEFEDYNGESRFLSDMIDDLRIINIKHGTNIIVCAHVITQQVFNMKGETTVERKRLITAGNKIGESLPGKFEEVFHFERSTSIDPTSSPTFNCYTRDFNGNGAGTTLNIDSIIEWTNKNFYKVLMMKVRKEIE